jgi:hypothetical protein
MEGYGIFGEKATASKVASMDKMGLFKINKRKGKRVPLMRLLTCDFLADDDYAEDCCDCCN